MKETNREREINSINEARKRLGMKPLYQVKGESYKSYLKEFERRRYSTELNNFKSEK